MVALQEKMNILRQECFKPFNIKLLNIDEKSTNSQIIKAVASLKESLYLFDMASEIVMSLIMIDNINDSNIEVQINSL